MPLLTVVGPRESGTITKLCDFYPSKTAAMSKLTSTFIHPTNGWRFVQELREREQLEAYDYALHTASLTMEDETE
jgi:hypothetical protein